VPGALILTFLAFHSDFTALSLVGGENGASTFAAPGAEQPGEPVHSLFVW